MGINIASSVPTINSAGEITSLAFAGDSDRTRIRLMLSSPTNPAFTATVQALPDPTTGAWTMDFPVFHGDLSCPDDIDIDAEWFDQATGWSHEDNFPISHHIDCAGAPQCSVTISRLEGIEAPSGQTGMAEVIVSGTASNCSNVEVTVFDVNPGANPITGSAAVINGAWTATLRMGDPGVGTRPKSYQCKEDHTVRAECASDAGCFSEGVYELECRSSCPDFASVEVSGGSLPAPLTDPNVGELQCLPAGRYRIAVTSPAAADVQSYTWFRDQNPATVVGTNRSVDVVLAAQSNVSYTVAIEMVNGCSPTRTVVFACGGPPDDENPPPPPPANGDDGEEPGGPGDGGGDDDGNGGGGCDFCCVWFIANIIALFATLIAFVVAGCVFQWLEPISTGIAIALAIAVTISIVAWAVFCNGRSGGSCQPILRWLDILDVLTILATILAFLMGVTTPCAIAFWINVGFLQWVRRILQTIAVITGCLPNPWFLRLR
jgi:hypothetical protein